MSSNRIKREMKDKYIEEKKKIWQKNISQEKRQRQKEKKLWQRERVDARSKPIFEEQKFIEQDTAQAEINDRYDLYYKCNCKNMTWSEMSLYCYNCEGRLHMANLFQEKDKNNMKENVTCLHPWGITKTIAEYSIPEIPTEIQDLYKNTPEYRREIQMRSKWFCMNHEKIMNSIRIFKSEDSEKRADAIKIAVSLIKNSKRLERFYYYCFDNYENIVLNPIYLMS